MLPFTKCKADCCGCTACMSACPVQCITMVQDEEGFRYPEADDRCIHCGKCAAVCPLANPLKKDTYPQKFYAGVSKQYDIWKRSASGGAFSEICRAWEKGNTLYAGAAWDGLDVRHRCVQGFDNIAPLCKSKYVESDLGYTFRQIKAHLDSGGRAVFCGTPCQVVGLKRFLGKDYPELLLVDLICHGAGSPLVFQSCMRTIGRQRKKTVKQYEFRAKRRIYERSYLAKITFEDDSICYCIRDPYIQLFLSQSCLRPSCEDNCRFRNDRRESDITIADFKGLTDVFPELTGEKRNYSSIILNSEKGERILPKLQETMELLPCTKEDIVRYNPIFANQSRMPQSKRAEFFEDYTCSGDSSIDRWTAPAAEYPESFLHIIFSCFPISLRRRFLRMKNKRG